MEICKYVLQCMAFNVIAQGMYQLETVSDTYCYEYAQDSIAKLLYFHK